MKSSPNTSGSKSAVVRWIVLGGGFCLYVAALLLAGKALRGSWVVFLAVPLLAILLPLPLLAVLSRIYNAVMGVTVDERVGPVISCEIGGSPALAGYLSDLIAESPGSDGYLCSIELFFDGNGEIGSIAANLTDHPGLAAFRECLMVIRKRAEVEAVLLGVVDFPPGEWPYVETILVFTSAVPEEVSAWAEIMAPDEVGAGLRHKTFAGMPACPPGMQPVHLWWD